MTALVGSYSDKIICFFCTSMMFDFEQQTILNHLRCCPKEYPAKVLVGFTAAPEGVIDLCHVHMYIYV